MAGMSGGEAANTIGTSLLGYWAGKKAEQRQGEIAERGAALSDPWAPMRGYYQGILGDMYGMPEGFTDKPPEGESKNAAENLITKLSGLLGGGGQGGGLLGGLLGGGGGAATGGMLGGLLG